MPYRASIVYDFSECDRGNEGTKLQVALHQAGWLKGETTAYFTQSDSLADVWKGIELFVKQCEFVGVLSALTLHVQLDEVVPINPQYLRNYPHSRSQIEDKDWPEPSE